MFLHSLYQVASAILVKKSIKKMLKKSKLKKSLKICEVALQVVKIFLQKL